MAAHVCESVCASMHIHTFNLWSCLICPERWLTYIGVMPKVCVYCVNTSHLLEGMNMSSERSWHHLSVGPMMLWHSGRTSRNAIHIHTQTGLNGKYTDVCQTLGFLIG